MRDEVPGGCCDAPRNSEHLYPVVFGGRVSTLVIDRLSDTQGCGRPSGETRRSRQTLVPDFFAPNGNERLASSLSRALWVRDAVTMAGVATMPSSAALPFCESCKQEVEAETNESNGFTCVPTRVPPSCLPAIRSCVIASKHAGIAMRRVRSPLPHLPRRSPNLTRARVTHFTTGAARSAARFWTTTSSPRTPRSRRPRAARRRLTGTSSRRAA